MLLRKIGAKKRKMRMSGKKSKSLNDLFVCQMKNQDKFLRSGIYDRFKDETTMTVPVDDVGLASYHVQQLMSEIGEVLEADKRWKSHRNDKNDKDGKLEELADCFIVLMNMVMFSGFDGNDLEEAIEKKLKKVSDRFEDA